MKKDLYSKKDYMTALILSIFLGQLGVDRFYLGKTGTGILKLLITLCSFGFLGWIWWIIDIIKIATKTMKDKDGLLLK